MGHPSFGTSERERERQTEGKPINMILMRTVAQITESRHESGSNHIISVMTVINHAHKTGPHTLGK